MTSMLDYDSASIELEESIGTLSDAMSDVNVPDAPFTRLEIDCEGTDTTVSIPDVALDTGDYSFSAGLDTGTGIDLDLGSNLDALSADTCYLVYQDEKSASKSSWKGVAVLVVPPFERWALVGGHLPSIPTLSLPTKAWGPSKGSVDAEYGTSTSSGAEDEFSVSLSARAEVSTGASFMGAEATVMAAIEIGMEESESEFSEVTYGTTYNLDSDVDNIEDHGVVVARTEYYEYKYEIEGGANNGKEFILHLPYDGDTQLWNLEDYNEYNDENDLDFAVGSHVVGSVDSYNEHNGASLNGHHVIDSVILDDPSNDYYPNLTGTTTWEHTVTSGNSTASTRSASLTLGATVDAFGTGVTVSATVGGSSSHTISVSTSTNFGGSFGSMSQECKNDGWDYAMVPYIYWAKFNTVASDDYPYKVVVVDYYLSDKGEAYDAISPIKTCKDTPFSMVFDPSVSVYLPVGEYLDGVNSGVDVDGVELDVEVQYDIDKLMDELLVVDGDQLAVDTAVLNQIYLIQGLDEITVSTQSQKMEQNEEQHGKDDDWSPKSDVAQYVQASEIKQKLGHTLKEYIHEDSKFSDLKKDHHNFVAIQYLAQNEVLDGYEDGSFKAENKVNRAEAIKIILEGLEIEGVESADLEGFEFKFPDASAKSWYAKYLKYAVDEEILVGYPDGNIKLSKTVNKVEFLKMLFESADLDMDDVGTLSDDDIPSDVSSDSWYLPYVTFAVDNDLVDLEDGNFNPGAELSRGDASEIVYRFFMVLMQG